MAYWGKAGQRLTEQEHREREDRREKSARMAAALTRPAVEKRYADARAAHAAGLVRPYLLTLWLDYRSADGPEVDAACGVEEPTVDRWEEGKLYPTWPQLEALAAYCQLPVWRFTEDMDTDPDRLFLCGRGVRRTAAPPRVWRFDPLALVAAGISPYETVLPVAEEHGQGRLL